MEIKKQRLLLLDGIRGFAIVNMVLFHFLYDFFIIYQKTQMVWQTLGWFLAADDLLDLYFHFRYDLEAWQAKKLTWPFA